MTTFENRKLYWLFITALLLPAFSVFAQNNKYSLRALTDSARSFLPSLLEKQYLMKAADATVTDTRHSFLPRLRFSEQVNIGSDNSLAGSYFTYGITPSTSAGVRDENNLQAVTGNVGILSGEYELVNFGLNEARIKNARAYVDLQQADIQKEEYLVESSIARLYFSILKNLYRLGADQQNIDRYREIFTVIKALTASGINAGVDSSLAKAELSKTIISYNQTRGKINQLREELAFYTGIPSSRLEIDTIGHDFIHANPSNRLFNADTINNPVINYYQRYQDIFSTTDRVIRKSYLPKILLNSAVWVRGSSIQYSDQYKSLATGLGYQRFNYVAGIALTYDLFNGVHRKDKLAINRFQQMAAHAQLQQQKLLLNSVSAQADQELSTIQSNLQELPVQLSAAEVTYRQKLAQYKAGIISLIDLTNASFVFYRSQTDFIEARSDWYLAQVDKAEANGNLIQFINSIN
ncbi:MAG: TolC family protein [Bacteroidetes bacterium]|nr:TolC family protein [Bacteroidota bacterium]